VTARRSPTYDLSEIQAKVRAGLFWITHSARRGAAGVGLGEDDIVSCILSLSIADFHKTMESETEPGLWQDVYRPVYEKIALYVKLQIDRDDAIVISFKAL
jgi:motility quorum-sensing regulator / GCU-specific mRNA interferase toxin